ncbi:heterokaryon incompatibility protein-domain-containing protein [Xylariomycetidae sp. FL0641]|nr:heterokaryon incompatibility protein-domain-containing protein [Xylariomycetidae sp. FL0641]
MRLLNCKSLLLETFAGRRIPPYATLSHTWGEDEIVYEDVAEPTRSRKYMIRSWGKRSGAQTRNWKDRPGALKILRSAAQASTLGYDYIWIDTCCIDKRSSAELSEAINSMFNWYQQSEVCLAYLSDVIHLSEIPVARWFTRGWTLQELLAPPNVRFYNTNWEYMGSRGSLADTISNITTIPFTILTSKFPRRWVLAASVAERMTWAAIRSTTRAEDIAYCLMGIFDVNMPLLYGEGQKAFKRLQEEILKTSNDQSILCTRDNDNHYDGLLAKHPIYFDTGYIMDSGGSATSHIELVKSTMTLSLLCCPVTRRHDFADLDEAGGATFRADYDDGFKNLTVAILDCLIDSGTSRGARLAITLRGYHGGPDMFTRERPSLGYVSAEHGGRVQYRDSESFQYEFDASKARRRRVTIVDQYAADLHRVPLESTYTLSIEPIEQPKSFHYRFLAQKTAPRDLTSLRYPKRYRFWDRVIGEPLYLFDGRNVQAAVLYALPKFLSILSKQAGVPYSLRELASVIPQSISNQMNEDIWCCVAPLALDFDKPDYMDEGSIPSSKGSRVLLGTLRKLERKYPAMGKEPVGGKQDCQDAAIAGNHRVHARVELGTWLEQEVLRLKVSINYDPELSPAQREVEDARMEAELEAAPELEVTASPPVGSISEVEEEGRDS